MRFSIVILYASIATIFANIEASNGLKTIENARIIIVGAGASGIAAASKLIENGFKNVTILEAENRIGGRIHTTSFGNYSVDLGGQWVQGENGNVVYDLAYPLGLLDKSENPNSGLTQVYFDSVGGTINEGVAVNLTDFFYDTVYGREPDNDATEESIGDYVERKFEDRFRNHEEVYREKAKYLKYFELTVTGDISAESWYDISVANNVEFKYIDGDDLISWKDRGYSTVLDVLMKRYPDPDKELPILNNTFLNSEVTSIQYESAPVIVTTKRGQVYTADHVVITASLGVLKEKHGSLFNPPLPDYKIKAIEGLGFGSVAKIYFLFDKPFWQLDGRRVLFFTFIWNDVDRKAIENDPQKSWLLGIVGCLTVQHKPNLLELWMGEKEAKAMEVLPDDKVFEHALENLHRFLDKTYDVTKPVAMLRSRWYTNPYFKGTYSYISVDSARKNASAVTLEQPVNLENLAILFAGEATSADRFSTVDGAIASGWNAANRLINFYKINNK